MISIEKLLGKKFDSDFLARALRYKWRPAGELEIILMLEGFIIFHFSNEYIWIKSELEGLGDRRSGASLGGVEA